MACIDTNATEMRQFRKNFNLNAWFES